MDCHFCLKQVINGKIIDSLPYCDICLKKSEQLSEKKTNSKYNFCDSNCSSNNNLHKYSSDVYTRYDLEEFHNY